MSKKDYDIEYIRTHCKRIALNLNIEYDKDIIEHLEKNKPINTYLKMLIREQIKKDGK